MNLPFDFSLSCPYPTQDSSRILLSHGGGGKMMNQLIDELILTSLSNPYLDQRHDGATLPQPHKSIVMTTDSYVISPLFFPGGDIGKLSIYGTVNDLLMCAARPQYLTLALILEEGLLMKTLVDVLQSIKEVTQKLEIPIVTGDTKVVERGKGDGIFISTTGLGTLDWNFSPHPRHINIGDEIIVSGDLGRHGMSILGARESFSFEPPIQSDCASLDQLIIPLLNQGIRPHCLRDLTRGGLSSALNEISSSCQKDFLIEENDLPIKGDVRSACEILGLDPLYVACEGRCILFIDPLLSKETLAILKSYPLGKEARRIGKVIEGKTSKSYKNKVILKTIFGVERLLDMMVGEQLPRIC